MVVPEVSSAAESFNMERNLLAGEIRRVKDFALLSENAYSSVQELDDILEYYNLSIFRYGIYYKSRQDDGRCSYG